MLGLRGKRDRKVSIYLEGKHPSFRDFIHVGIEGLLAQALRQWARSGYAEWLERRDSGHEAESWRFWTNGPARGQVAWGILRDSSDSIGRPHPLFILACCYARGWEKAWEQLPRVLDESWKGMEYLAARRFHAADELQREMAALALKRPGLGADDSKQGVTSLRDNAGCAGMESMEQELGRQRIKRCRVLRFFLGGDASASAIDNVLAWHMLLKQQISMVPRAVFAGGPAAQPYLYVFYRPLVQQDFVDMWSISMHGNGEKYGHIQPRQDPDTR